MPVDLRVTMVLNAALDNLHIALEIIEESDHKNSAFHLQVLRGYNRTMESLLMVRDQEQAAAELKAQG